MKRLLIAFAALATLTTGVAAEAQPGHRDRDRMEMRHDRQDFRRDRREMRHDRRQMRRHHQARGRYFHQGRYYHNRYRNEGRWMYR